MIMIMETIKIIIIIIIGVPYRSRSLDKSKFSSRVVAVHVGILKDN